MFFRARIGLLAAAIIGGLTALVATTVSSRLTDTVGRQSEVGVDRAQATLPSLDLLRGIEQTNETARFAREDEFGDIFAKGTIDEQRKAAFEAVTVRNV